MDQYQRRTNKLRSDYMDSGGGGGGRRYDENYYQDDRSGGRNYHSHNDDYEGYYDDSSRRHRSRSPNRNKSNRSRNDDNYERGGNGHYSSSSSSSTSNSSNNLQPTRTILIRQLPMKMSDDDLMFELNSIGMTYKQVRLVKSRETGLNRGFAFVEFNSIDEAKYWIDSTRGFLIFPNYNNVRVQICFSHSNEDPFKSDSSALNTEWHCAKCGIKNFKKRDKCFKCGLTREESDRRIGGEAYDYCGQTPCNTLVLRGLDALTTNDSIKEALSKLSNYTVQVRNSHIARDPLTNVSSGFAFVEFGSIQESSAILQLAQPFFELDGKQITLSYSKNNFQTAKSQLESNLRTAFEQIDTSRPPPPRNDNFSSTSSSFSKQANQTVQVNSAAAVAQAAIQSMAKKQELISQLTSNLKQTPQTTEKMKAPDPSQFTYDETSGYYYDYSTGLYYDPTTYYYYNSTTQQYLYWDPVSMTYVPVVSAAATETSTTTTTTETKKEEQSVATTTTTTTSTPTTKPAAKNAVQIAKEMEKWAQQMNKKKETTSTVVKKPTTTETQKSSHFQILNTTTTMTMTPSGNKSQQQSFDYANSSSNTSNSFRKLETLETSSSSNKKSTETTSNQRAGEEEKFATTHLIDETKLTCLLCKRKFDSLDILNKHVAKSDLHKKNLEALKQQQHQQQSKKRESSPDSPSANKRPC